MTADKQNEAAQAGDGAVCLDYGGPTLKISVGGVIHEFEDHPYCGPVKLTKRGEPSSHQPGDFLLAASLWYQQGKLVENGLCRWKHEAEPILRHMGGKHWALVGWNEPRDGA